MFRTIAHLVTAAVAGFAITMLVLVAGADQARADVPLVTDNPIVDVSGSRASGFSLEFQSGGTWVTGSLHEELAGCRAEFAKGSKGRVKCAGIVRGSMRDYVAIRNAG